MQWWTLEQALAWGMWRDQARAERCGEGRLGAIEPRELAKVPALSDAAWQQIVADLLVRGEVDFVPIAADRPDCGYEERGYVHEESGCYVFLRGWRQRPDAPLCLLEALYWVPPREEPILDYMTAKFELEQALREGRVHAVGEGLPGQSIDLPAKAWLFVEIGLTSSNGQIGVYRPHNHDAGDQSGISRPRVPVDEIKALWPDENSKPSTQSGQYQRKRGRPATPTETMTTMAASLLERGVPREQILAVLRGAIATERCVGSDHALKVARSILAAASVGNS